MIDSNHPSQLADSDSATRDSDSSEMLSDSVATCMQENAADARGSSHFTSTEIIAGNSAEVFADTVATAASVQPPVCQLPGGHPTANTGGPPKVVMRTKRRNSERPWSVSCLSQLKHNTDATQQRAAEQAATNQGLANHSISESALDMWCVRGMTSASSTTATPAGRQPNVGGSVGRSSAATSATTMLHQSQSSMRSSIDSKNSLKRRKMRARKKSMGRKSGESGCSNGSSDHAGGGATSGTSVQELSRLLTTTLSKSETFAGRTSLVEDLTEALSMMTTALPMAGNASGGVDQQQPQQQPPIASSDQESEEEQRMMKPNFRLGAYTSGYGASKLGSLAALANYNSGKERKHNRCHYRSPSIISRIAFFRPSAAKELSHTGTDNSNEQAWDPYQDRYNSEAYSEGLDSDAARRLLEFGDDYRNFLDSQSDCCSSLSTANNLDSSLSPLMSRRVLPMPLNVGVHAAAATATWSASSKSASKSPVGGADEAALQRRGRRVPDFEFDRRRRSSESSRKMQMNGLLDIISLFS